MTIFEDAEENIWLGFNGDGLSILSTDSLSFMLLAKIPGQII